jgi:hypothetical protein
MATNVVAHNTFMLDAQNSQLLVFLVVQYQVSPYYEEDEAEG